MSLKALLNYITKKAKCQEEIYIIMSTKCKNLLTTVKLKVKIIRREYIKVGGNNVKNI